MKKLLTLLFVTFSTTAFAQTTFDTFTEYKGDCVKRDIVDSAFLKKIPQTKIVYQTDIISVIKHPQLETYLELVYNPNGCFIGTQEMSAEELLLLLEAI